MSAAAIIPMAAKVKKEKKAAAGESSRDQSEQSADSRKDSRQSENRRSFPVEQSLELWDAFLSRWPIERLERMTLPEYTAVGSRDSFTYWLEIKLESLGNIFGSNSVN